MTEQMAKVRPRRLDVSDVIGRRFGRLVVTAFDHDEYKDVSGGRRQVSHFFKCKCDCGNEVVVAYSTLTSPSAVKSCGCYNAEQIRAQAVANSTFDPKAVIGERYGRLVIIAFDHDEETKEKCSTRASGFKTRTLHYVRCKCDCGNEIVINYKQLKKSRQPTESCGCLKREMLVKRNTTHGLLNDPLAKRLYINVYQGMIKRCYDPTDSHYELYGGRGIKICDEWYTPGVVGNPGFVNFYKWAIANGYKADLSEKGRNRISIDRIDPNKDYEPSNCRWADDFTQANNRRNVGYIMDIDGVRIHTGDFSRKYNMAPSADVWMLRERGWTDDAIRYYVFFGRNYGMHRSNSKYTPEYLDENGNEILIPNLRVLRYLYNRTKNRRNE